MREENGANAQRSDAPLLFSCVGSVFLYTHIYVLTFVRIYIHMYVYYRIAHTRRVLQPNAALKHSGFYLPRSVFHVAGSCYDATEEAHPQPNASLHSVFLSPQPPRFSRPGELLWYSLSGIPKSTQTKRDAANGVAASPFPSPPPL